jgi:lactoylglutathione lyase
MARRAFPVIYARDVERTARFYGALGFEEHFRLPDTGSAGYIGLRRGPHELAVTSTDSPEQLVGIEVGAKPRFEMFVYVDNVEQAVESVRTGGGQVLKDPENMFWGERVAWVADPEGNPVALALEVEHHFPE